MKFTLSWLAEHLETDAGVPEIVERLTMLGLEVDSATDRAEGLRGFTVGRVVESKPHPDADRLSVCTVDTGSGTVDVVCGAPNARTSMKGVFAPVGSFVPGTGMKLKKTKIRGVESNGMLLSEREMNISDNHDGIIDLPDDAEVGAPAVAVMGLDDTVFDIDITPNRGDCLGVRGIARDLAAAGLKRINISLDSLHADRFAELTRRDNLGRVLDGIDAAIEAGLDPVKVNVVVMRDVNDDEIVDLARFGRERGVEVRFIEFMPLDADRSWSDGAVVGCDEIVARIAEVFPLEPVDRTSAPATRYRYLDGAGCFGVVASVTRSFCDTCDRIRLTADGQFRNCLFAVEEFDLRSLLRSGASDEDLSELLQGAVAAKWAGHGISSVDFIRPNRSMSQIGG